MLVEGRQEDEIAGTQRSQEMGGQASALQRHHDDSLETVSHLQRPNQEKPVCKINNASNMVVMQPLKAIFWFVLLILPITAA